MKGTYIGNNRALVSTVWGGQLIVPTDDLSMAPNLISYGIHEVDLSSYLFKNIKKGWTVMDVGANIGYFTVLLGYIVGPEGKVIAYEADPGSYSFLLDNLSINYLHDRVTTCNKAVYSSRGKLSFYIAERFRGNSSLNRHGEEYFTHYRDNIREIEVEAEPLDIYCGQLSHINLIKLDIEGGEYQAFKGMARLIENRAVDTVAFELNKQMLKDDWLPFYKLLTEIKESRGARFFTLTPEGETVPTETDRLFENGSPTVIMKL